MSLSVRRYRTRVLLGHLPVAGSPLETALPNTHPAILPKPQSPSLLSATSPNPSSGRKKKRLTSTTPPPQSVEAHATTGLALLADR